MLHSFFSQVQTFMEIGISSYAAAINNAKMEENWKTTKDAKIYVLDYKNNTELLTSRYTTLMKKKTEVNEIVKRTSRFYYNNVPDIIFQLKMIIKDAKIVTNHTSPLL